MKVLIVAQSHSIHIGRWINQFSDPKWNIYLFPIFDLGSSSYLLEKGVVFHTFFSYSQNRNQAKKYGIPLPFQPISYILRKTLGKLFPNYQRLYLSFLIWFIRPDVVHSVSLQSTYLVSDIKNGWKGFFPQWVITNWGHDLFLMGTLPLHKHLIKRALKQCDIYTYECKRDLRLTPRFGLKKKTPTFLLPSMGGYDLTHISSIRSKIKTSRRKIVLLKGYQHWAGRCLVGLEALKHCVLYLRGYTIVVYSVSDPAVELAVQLFSVQTGIKSRIIPYNTLHEKILTLHSKARISIGLSISDGISASFLEAIACGSFPIQSDTSCANEWIENGKTGILVPPEDPYIIARAIKKGLTDDKLVDNAAVYNWKTVKNNADEKDIKIKAEQMYITSLEKYNV